MLGATDKKPELVKEELEKPEKEITHFKMSFYSEVENLGGLNAGLVAHVKEDVEYGINIGGVGCYEYLSYGANLGILAIGKEAKFGANIGLLAAGVIDMKGGLNVGAYTKAENMKYGLNIGVRSIVEDDLTCGANVGFGTRAGDMEYSFSIGAWNYVNNLIKSVELGLVNYAEENLGLQIGLVNISGQKEGEIDGKKRKGRMIGLINIDLSKKWYKSLTFIIG